MKILLATSEVPPTLSGMARVAERLTDGFRVRGHEVDVLASERLPRLAVREMRIPVTASSWRSISRRIRAADVLSLHGPIPAFSDLLLLSSRFGQAPRPLAYTHHMDIGFGRLRFLTRPYEAAMRRLAARAGAVIVSTEATAATFGRHPNVRVVPFGVDLDRVGDEAKFGEFSALFVGQLRPYKGVDVLLRAMARLPDVRLRIAGRGFAEASLRELAAKLGLANVEFLGPVPEADLWSLYARSHVLVQPSVEMEFFGLAMLEGMASGCVPVISDLPGPAEVLGDAGVVVARGDDAALARAIARLRDDPAGRAALSERGRARAGGFTWDRCIDRHLEIYTSLVQ